MMMKYGVLVVLILSVMLLSSAVQAGAWTSSALYNSLLADVQVTPSYSPSGSWYSYSYGLKNVTATDVIASFVLTIPNNVPVSSLSGFVLPTGWTTVPSQTNNQVQWVLTNQNYALQPGATDTFGFTTAFEPSSSKVLLASSQGAWGYSGSTLGPVPEPGSAVALITGLVGLVGLKKRPR